ncbi:hypothetical protein [Marinirhabdus gelatinilytica]|uniref:Uncharacterized protein n=1 Tax=Marinirhabdus gelatinilytica TaxID=1703343 RepID=A0A370QLT4_9FLAO|nr:hypothetical protein [Marinirhabdus gelatinilytica]RDK89323.1 hypothetical protein C8D94_1011209 [Marinirhabdus gelatinilytica]
MKQLSYLFLLLLCVGCANVSEEKATVSSDMVEMEATEATSSTVIEEAFPYAIIAEQKLQEYFDLLALQNKHPEMGTVISKQLEGITSDSIVLPRGQDSIDVKNLSPMGSLQQLNDTVMEQRFTYTIASRTLFKTDTIIARIITKPIVIDGMATQETKVVFRKN